MNQYVKHTNSILKDKAKLEEKLLKIDGIIGAGINLKDLKGAKSDPVIVVYTDQDKMVKVK